MSQYNEDRTLTDLLARCCSQGKFVPRHSFYKKLRNYTRHPTSDCLASGENQGRYSIDTKLTDTKSKRRATQRFRSHHCLRKLLAPRQLIGFQDRCIKPLCHPSRSLARNGEMQPELRQLPSGGWSFHLGFWLAMYTKNASPRPRLARARLA
jgi:hypothetical protein